MVMPVAPAYASGGSGFGNSFGGDWAWIILLLLLCGNGWGNGFGGGYGGGDLYPWMNQSNQMNGGFRDQMLNSSINGIQQSITSGFGDVQNALCGGFAGVNAAVSNGFAQAEISENARQMANMNQMFGIQSSLQQCCCDNRAATADLKYTIATEANATRAADSANTQVILDKLCQLELDNVKAQLEAKNDTIAQLRSEILYSRGQASQDVQTANIQAGQRALANEIEQYVAPRAIPSYIVQNPNCCAPNYGCGCAA